MVLSAWHPDPSIPSILSRLPRLLPWPPGVLTGVRPLLPCIPALLPRRLQPAGLQCLLPRLPPLLPRPHGDPRAPRGRLLPRLPVVLPGVPCLLSYGLQAMLGSEAPVGVRPGRHAFMPSGVFVSM